MVGSTTINFFDFVSNIEKAPGCGAPADPLVAITISGEWQPVFFHCFTQFRSGTMCPVAGATFCLASTRLHLTQYSSDMVVHSMLRTFQAFISGTNLYDVACL